MMIELRDVLRNILSYRIYSKNAFYSYDYQRHNQRRLEHLESLRLSIAGSTVLEVGAGIGDHTSYFLDRDCRVVTSDSRKRNINILRSRYPDLRALYLDLDNPPEDFNEVFDIVYSYGLLYHLCNPAEAINFMSKCCRKMLLLETCVSVGEGNLINPVKEVMTNPSQAKSGRGCRPTRRWVYDQLKKNFDYVYLPLTQPNHCEFPLDWTIPPPKGLLTRAVFVASRQSLSSDLLSSKLLMKQVRH